MISGFSLMAFALELKILFAQWVSSLLSQAPQVSSRPFPGLGAQVLPLAAFVSSLAALVFASTKMKISSIWYYISEYSPARILRWNHGLTNWPILSDNQRV